MKIASPLQTTVDTAVSTFSVVSHRKDNKLGIPLAIRPRDTGDLCKTNPRQLHQEILHSKGETPTWLKFANTRSVEIDVRSEAPASRLLVAKGSENTKVDTQIQAAYMKNSALIRGIPTDYSDDELEEFLRYQVVIRPCHRRHLTQPDITILTKDVLVHFAPNTGRPDKVDLDFWVRVLRERTPISPRCYKCRRFGHVSRRCACTVPRCSFCSGAHE